MDWRIQASYYWTEKLVTIQRLMDLWIYTEKQLAGLRVHMSPWSLKKMNISRRNRHFDINFGQCFASFGLLTKCFPEIQGWP